MLNWTNRLVLTALLCIATTGAYADSFGTGSNQFNIDFVTISGDAGDLGSWPAGSNYNFTGVNRGDYRIGVYEITNDQWDKFTAQLGVPVTGTPAVAYSKDTHFAGANIPTSEVSWYEAAQFVNWLNTSQGYQPAYKFTGTQGTEDYAIDVWSEADAYNGTNLYRHKDAFYYLPSEDEWTKAAYWNGSMLQDAATKAGDTLFQGDGVSGTGWNYNDGNGTVFTPPAPWEVGSGSEELNGTYDMMGNFWEFIESPQSHVYGATYSRVIRGGSYWYQGAQVISSYRGGNQPQIGNNNIGFRIAANVPEPSSLLLLSLAGLAVVTKRR